MLWGVRAAHDIHHHALAGASARHKPRLSLSGGRGGWTKPPRGFNHDSIGSAGVGELDVRAQQGLRFEGLSRDIDEIDRALFCSSWPRRWSRLGAVGTLVASLLTFPIVIVQTGLQTTQVHD